MFIHINIYIYIYIFIYLYWYSAQSIIEKLKKLQVGNERKNRSVRHGKSKAQKVIVEHRVFKVLDATCTLGKIVHKVWWHIRHKKRKSGGTRNMRACSKQGTQDTKARGARGTRGMTARRTRGTWDTRTCRARRTWGMKARRTQQHVRHEPCKVREHVEHETL